MSGTDTIAEEAISLVKDDDKNEEIDDKVEIDTKKVVTENVGLVKKLSQEEEQFIKRFGSLQKRNSLLVSGNKKKRFDSADYFTPKKSQVKK